MGQCMWHAWLCCFVSCVAAVVSWPVHSAVAARAETCKHHAWQHQGCHYCLLATTTSEQTRQQAPSSSGYSSSSSIVTISTGVAQLHPWICNSGHRLGCMNFIQAVYSAETYAVAFFCWVRQLFISHTCNGNYKRQVENHLPKLQVTVTAWKEAKT